MLSAEIQAVEVDLVTGAHLSGNRVVHQLVIVLQGTCGASVSGGACGACFSHVCGESTRGGIHRIMVGGGAHLTSFAVLAARTSVGVHPASFCRDRSTCASGGVHRVCTYACCGCGDSSSCAVSAASVVVYIATLLAEFWELASDAHAVPASVAEYTFPFCGVCGARSTCTQRQQHRRVIVFVGQAPCESRGEFSVLRCDDNFYFQHRSGRALEGRAVRQGHGTAITAGVELGGSPWRSSSNWSLTYRPRDRDDGRTC